MTNNNLAQRQLDRSKHREMLIQNLGIFELRALGRELGVASPTTKRRDELIDLILDQIYSDDPTVRISKRGRPFKKLTNLNDIMSDMTGTTSPDALSFTTKPRKYEDVVCFAQEVPVFSHVVEVEAGFKGIIRQAPNVFYFLDFSADDAVVYIPNELVKKYNLSAGDIIEVRARQINSQNQFLVTVVTRINFLAVYDYQKKISKGTPIISNEKLPYGEFELFCGRRNMVGYDNNLYEDRRFLDFTEFCKDNGYKLITLSVNTSFEDHIMFSGVENMVNLTTVYGSVYDDGFKRIVDAVALTERLVENGEKCVLFINDIVSIFDTLDLCYPNAEEKNGHKEDAIIVAKKLIALGRALSDGASATLVMTYRKDDKDDNYLLYEAKKVSKIF